MSRTYKDKKWELRFPEDSLNHGMEKVPYTTTLKYFNPDEGHFEDTGVEVTRYIYRPVKGAKTKKRKHADTNWHWMTTPSWWTRMMMNRPQRREAHLWEHSAAHTPLESLEELDKPNVSHKPHKYYW